MKKNLLIIVFTIAAFSIAFAAFYIWSVPKTSYVEVSDLYNSFELKKELELKFQKTQKAREKMLDSLRVQLNTLSRRIEMEKKKNQENIAVFYSLRDDLELKQQQFDEDNDAMAQEYKNQIWKRLNQYITDYGKEKGYDYIYGLDDSYNVLYAKPTHNVTEELKLYVQKRYTGK